MYELYRAEDFINAQEFLLKLMEKSNKPVDIMTGSLDDFNNQLGVNQDPIEQLEGQ